MSQGRAGTGPGGHGPPKTATPPARPSLHLVRVAFGIGRGVAQRDLLGQMFPSFDPDVGSPDGRAAGRPNGCSMTDNCLARRCAMSDQTETCIRAAEPASTTDVEGDTAAKVRPSIRAAASSWGLATPGGCLNAASSPASHSPSRSPRGTRSERRPPGAVPRRA